MSGLISQTSNSIAKYAGDISEAEQRALAYEQEIKQKEEKSGNTPEKAGRRDRHVPEGGKRNLAGHFGYLL